MFDKILNGLQEITDWATAITMADEKTTSEAFIEQAKMILYEAETLTALVEEERNSDLGVVYAGRTDRQPA